MQPPSCRPVAARERDDVLLAEEGRRGPGGHPRGGPMVRLVVVDDHEVFRIGLRTVLEYEPDLRVVGEAGDATAGVQAAVALRPDLVLMDVRLGGIDGVTACREIRSQLPEVRVLMLTSFAD